MVSPRRKRIGCVAITVVPNNETRALNIYCNYAYNRSRVAIEDIKERKKKCGIGRVL